MARRSVRLPTEARPAVNEPVARLDHREPIPAALLEANAAGTSGIGRPTAIRFAEYGVKEPIDRASEDAAYVTGQTIVVDDAVIVFADVREPWSPE